MEATNLVILFGSRAKQTAKEDADFDIAVLSDHKLSDSENESFRITTAHTLGISEDKIDLVDLFNAPPLIWQEVAQSGKLLSGKEDRFLRFKVLAWKRYLDAKKLYDMRLASLKS